MVTGGKIKVLVVDDHPLMRAGISSLLKQERDIQIAGEVANGEEAILRTKELQPDIVLIDISMPHMDGFEATKQIVSSGGKVRVLVLTQHDHEEYIKRIVQAGASGYILKSAVADELIRGIRAVHGGGQFFTAEVSRIMVESYVRQTGGERLKHTGDVLTNREREVLKYVAEGRTNQQVAGLLNISVRTVEFHRANIGAKIGAHDTASFVKYAIQKKIIRLDPHIPRIPTWLKTP
jgi:two-component system response regulator NreC